VLMKKPVPMEGVTKSGWKKDLAGGWYRGLEDVTQQMQGLAIVGSTPKTPPGVVPAPPSNNLPLAAINPRVRRKNPFPKPSPSMGEAPMNITLTGPVPQSSMQISTSAERVMNERMRVRPLTVGSAMRGVEKAPKSPPAPKRPPDQPLVESTLVDFIPMEDLEGALTLNMLRTGDLGMKKLKGGKKSLTRMVGGRY
jgi:hypothetical protein